MALRFRCEKCGKRLTVNEEAGAEVTCPHCNQRIVVPAEAQGSDGAPAPAVAEPVAVTAEPQAASAAPAEGEGDKDKKEEEEAQEEGMGTVMGFFAMYLPSYGTSILLHVAIGLFIFFFSSDTRGEVQVPFKYSTAVVADSKPKVEKKKDKSKNKEASRSRRPGTGGEASRGKLKPQISGLLRQFTTNPFPDVASNNLNEVQVIGVGAGGKQIGGFEGLGTGSGRGTGTGGGGFFGAGGDDEGEANKIVYIVDRSGSMTDSIDYVKYELKRSIRELGPEKQFHIIFYSSGPALEMPARRLVSATEANKQKAFEFVDGIIAQGETDPDEAIKRAFACGCELIYLLTDGEFDKSVVDTIKGLNKAGKVTIHTIGFIYKDGEKILKDIASQNNGNYKFVSEADLATLVQ
jgi:DNA-directed RNA polymerase subunit RPC12/RpoP